MLSALAAIFLAAAPELAAGQEQADGGGRRGDESLRRLLVSFDLDRSRSLDEQELEAVNKALAQNPAGPLAAFDKNADGQIDQSEASGAMTGGGGMGGALQAVDRDGNRKIEGDDEIEALLQAFENAPKGSALRSLDRNRNLQLDDDEIAALNERLATRGNRQSSPHKQPAERTRRQDSASNRAMAVRAEPPEAASDAYATGTGSATIAWQAPMQNVDGTPLTNLVGFTIHYGRSAAQLDQRVVLRDSKQTRYTFEELDAGTWYVAVSALTSTGAESRPTDTVQIRVASATVARK